MTRTLLAFVLAVAVATPLGSQGRIPVMILDGESGGPYHDWRRVTIELKRMLDEAGIFETTVVTAPPAGGDFAAFTPAFEQYRAVVMNYDAPDERWPASLKTAFERYVSGGGGLVSVHASDNAFPGWTAFNQMIGVGGWRGRNEKAGPYWYLLNGTHTGDMTPGPAGSHGRREPFAVVTVPRESDHPIMRGLPRRWMHSADELYARMRGPGKDMTILATAFSDPGNNGTGRDEPILMVIGFGKGRVFHTVLGHDVTGMSSVGFAVTLQRGTEWAATGQVTQKVPANFK